MKISGSCWRDSIKIKSTYFLGGNRWEAARRYGFSPHEILDFSANINPWTYSLGIEEIVRANLKEVYHFRRELS